MLNHLDGVSWVLLWYLHLGGGIGWQTQVWQSEIFNLLILNKIDALFA
jgi:hypothetical protein